MQDVQKVFGNNQPEETPIQNQIKKYLPYWPLFLILTTISISITYFHLHYQIPLYNASATLLIKDSYRGGGEQSELMQQINVLDQNKVVENEIEVIRSRKLAKEVARNLHLYASVAQEGRIQDRSAYLFSPVVIQARNPDSLHPVGKVNFTYDPQKLQVVIDGNRYSINEWHKLPYGELMFILNKYNSNPGIPSKPLYFSLNSIKSTAYGLLGKLNVKASSEMSSVLKLDILDEVPQRAEDILNEWISCYNRAAIEDKNILAANTLRFIEERLKFLEGDLDSVEHQVERFKSVNKVVDISAQGQQFLQSVSQNDQRLAEMNLQLAMLGQVENYVFSKNNKSGIVPATLGVSDPVLMQLLQGLYEAETQYEKLKKTMAGNFPSMKALADQMEKMRGNILENLRNQRRNIETSRKEISSYNLKFSSLLSSLPKKERELVDISRQQTIKNNIYTFLLQKREETALSAASTVADSRVVDAAESNYGAILANSRMMYSMAVLAAILIGVGIISIKEILNRTILFRDEIEKSTSIPILGEVAYDRNNNSIVIGEGKRTVIAEQFRHLRTYLGFLGINGDKKKILVTSTISGEGKSFVVTNLGISLALLGKKVVLLELDLRKPKLSEMLDIPRTVGISNFLAGVANADEIIFSTEENPNLFVVPSGPIPPNPSELLLNSKLQELLGYLENSFDYIIIDTAPVQPVTDALLIMPLCNVTLYVIRHGYTPKKPVQRLDDLYRANGQKNMAIVFNGMKGRGFVNYGYGYGYGYGYTQEEAKKKKKRKKVVS